MPSVIINMKKESKTDVNQKSEKVILLSVEPGIEEVLQAFDSIIDLNQVARTHHLRNQSLRVYWA